MRTITKPPTSYLFKQLKLIGLASKIGFLILQSNMAMNTYYTTKLYPLQDKVLSLISSFDTPFYLTGGTALSRGYYNHRYSDDLDFFVNQNSEFAKLSTFILNQLNSKFTCVIKHRSDYFVSLFLEDQLKIDFVNDIAFHSGELNALPIFCRVDNVQNILSNKLSALISRDEPKDVVDILTIAKNEKIDWPKIFTDANSKAVGIFPPLVVERLNEFPLELIKKIKWVGAEPDINKFQEEVSVICQTILNPLKP